MKPLIFTDVSIGYKDLLLINEVNLKISEPKIIAIVGKNGCGKSTLFNTLIKIQNPISGKIVLNTNDISATEITTWNKNFSVFFPKRITPPISVLETLLIGSRQSLLSIEDKTVLKLFGIESLLSKKINTLSSGQLQKVLVAKAFLGKASYVLLDEPFSHLDWEIRNDILLLLPKLCKTLNKTIIIISHDIFNLFNCAEDLWFITEKKLYHDSVVKALIKFNVVQKLIGSKYSYNYKEHFIEFKRENTTSRTQSEIQFLTELWNRKNLNNQIYTRPSTKEDLLILLNQEQK